MPTSPNMVLEAVSSEMPQARRLDPLWSPRGGFERRWPGAEEAFWFIESGVPCGSFGFLFEGYFGFSMVPLISFGLP